MRDHTKLRAFELADEVTLHVYKATRSFPREEVFGLTSQMRRAAVSAACNIVEGCARDSQADFVHFLSMAYGSAREVQYNVSLASRLGYLSAADARLLRDKSTEATKVLNGLIRRLREKK